ncbi:deoxyuridine 5 -triphosphat [Tubulinosema ratisbonensis]|uniref:Deoxyuridine 5'-triphosphate nucleotidohydrolase n=1 Tax=Tubulinosema ratisbonensis TaxID=291195 RepID=A0A437AM86_9MICR|nr:deoxyuridine 5 -triphosphat [Tubulinosema ratisbonensis]
MKFKILRACPEVKPIKLVNGEYEIYALEEITIHPDTQNKVKTGIRMEFNENYFAFINYENDSLQTLAGVVDSDYRGEIIVMLYNFGDKPVTIRKNEKCANITFHAIKHKLMVEIF